MKLDDVLHIGAPFALTFALLVLAWGIAVDWRQARRADRSELENMATRRKLERVWARLESVNKRLAEVERLYGQLESRSEDGRRTG